MHKYRSCDYSIIPRLPKRDFMTCPERENVSLSPPPPSYVLQQFHDIFTHFNFNKDINYASTCLKICRRF